MNTERCIRSGEWSIHLEHFQYMLEIDRCRSISAAARSLGLVQTTLSSIVKNVESALGFPIFQRTPNGVAPTVFGEQFLTLGGEIRVRFEELLRLKSGVSGSIDPIHVYARPASIWELPSLWRSDFINSSIMAPWSLRNAPGLKSSRKYSRG